MISTPFEIMEQSLTSTTPLLRRVRRELTALASDPENDLLRERLIDVIHSVRSLELMQDLVLREAQNAD